MKSLNMFTEEHIIMKKTAKQKRLENEREADAIGRFYDSGIADSILGSSPLYDSIEIIPAPDAQMSLPLGWFDLRERASLHAKNIELLGQRQAILALLRSRFDSRTTTLAEIDALRHADACIGNPALFLTIVEPWYWMMLEREWEA